MTNFPTRCTQCQYSYTVRGVKGFEKVWSSLFHAEASVSISTFSNLVGGRTSSAHSRTAPRISIILSAKWIVTGQDLKLRSWFLFSYTKRVRLKRHAITNDPVEVSEGISFWGRSRVLSRGGKAAKRQPRERENEIVSRYAYEISVGSDIKVVPSKSRGRLLRTNGSKCSPCWLRAANYFSPLLYEREKGFINLKDRV